MTQEIPFPTLTRRYVELKDLPSAARLSQAEATSAADLAAEFAESVDEFAGFSTTQPFFEGSSEHRDADKDSKSDARTYGWAMTMKRQATVDVEGDSALSFRYVEREIVPTRTRPASGFASPDGKGVRVDLLLANATSGRPIVGELKISTDKDPFTGLVQALAGAAQLVSPRQRDRLTGLSAPVESFERDRLLDVYVLLGHFPEQGRHRFEQLKRAVEFATELEGHPIVQQYVGLIRVLALKRSPEDRIEATTELPLR